MMPNDDQLITGREPVLGGEESPISGDEPSLSAEFVVAQLLETVPSGDKHARRRVFGELKRIQGAALPKLIDALKDPNWKIRRAAALALREIKPADAVSDLLAALHDSSMLVRRAVYDALKAIGKPAVPGLLVAIEDPDDDVRQRVKWLLLDIKDPRLVEYHIGIVKNLDNERGVRNASIAALGRIGDRAATPTLLTALKDRNSTMRLAAANALRNMKDKDAVPDLITSLRDNDFKVRFSAAWALGSLRDRRAVPALLRILALDMHPNMRYIAATSLGKIRDPKAVPGLIADLIDVDIVPKVASIEALGKIKDTSALVPLRLCLIDSSPVIRLVAQNAINQIEGR